MTGPVAKLLPDGKRLHLQHGPIDLIIGAEGLAENCRTGAFQAATQRFGTVLEELVAELPDLRLTAHQTDFKGTVAGRMADAVRPHSGNGFVTPMAAVAGAVADEVLRSMVRAVTLQRAYVNNGGDIALHLHNGERFRMAMVGLGNLDLGRIEISASDNVRGIATSGLGGRSLTFGIAESVTVLAQTAAAADAAATLIANAVNLPDHPAIRRQVANTIDPESDLGDGLVVTGCRDLSQDEVARALDNGARVAHSMQARGLISAACLFLRNQSRQVIRGTGNFQLSDQKVAYA